MREFEFPVKNAIEFANTNTGEQDKTMSIVLKAPTAKDNRAYFKMRGMVSECVTAMSKYAKEGQQSDGSELTAGNIAMMISVGAGDKLPDLIDAFCTLAKRVGEVAEGVRLNDAHIEQLEPEEIMDMTAQYVHFFIMPSLRSAMEGK